jgi:fatty acid desaturase
VIAQPKAPAPAQHGPREFVLFVLMVVATVLAFRAAALGDDVVTVSVGVLGLSLLSVQLVLVFHDCMHQSLFAHRWVNTWVARAIGALAWAPFHVLKANHLQHHKRAGLVQGDTEVLHPSRESAQRRRFGRQLVKLAHTPLAPFLYAPLLQLSHIIDRVVVSAHDVAERRKNLPLLVDSVVDVLCMIALWSGVLAFLVQHERVVQGLALGFVAPWASRTWRRGRCMSRCAPTCSTTTRWAARSG